MFGVKDPPESKLNELICSFDNLQTPLSQDEIELLFKKAGIEYKRQVKHPAELGWGIRSRNAKSGYIFN